MTAATPSRVTPEQPSGKPGVANGARIEILERRRREMAAAYVKAARRHAPRAALGKRLVRATCDALRAEIAARQEAEKAVGDLFARLGAAP